MPRSPRRTLWNEAACYHVMNRARTALRSLPTMRTSVISLACWHVGPMCAEQVPVRSRCQRTGKVVLAAPLVNKMKTKTRTTGAGATERGVDMRSPFDKRLYRALRIGLALLCCEMGAAAVAQT